MSMETDIIMRTMLYNALKGRSVAQIQRSLKAMCTEDMVAAVEKRVAEDLLAEEQETKGGSK